MDPVRSCIGCGRKAPKGELFRLVLAEPALPTVDPLQRAPGRGAYLCGPGCLAAAVKRKALQRAFKGQATPGGYETLKEALEQASLSTRTPVRLS
jgi:uncharacterized protein